MGEGRLLVSHKRQGVTAGTYKTNTCVCINMLDVLCVSGKSNQLIMLTALTCNLPGNRLVPKKLTAILISEYYIGRFSSK